MEFNEQELQALEETLGYSNVTRLRESFLAVVEQLQKNPAKRFLITKHGLPQAVLMSFRTYTLLKRLMDQTMSSEAEESRDEAIRSALARMRAERQPLVEAGASTEMTAVAAKQPNVRAAIRTLQQDLNRLESALEEEQQAPGTSLVE